MKTDLWMKKNHLWTNVKEIILLTDDDGTREADESRGKEVLLESSVAAVVNKYNFINRPQQQKTLPCWQNALGASSVN